MFPQSKSVGMVTLKKTVSLLHPAKTTETYFNVSNSFGKETLG